MGALHDGHAALVRHARSLANAQPHRPGVVVSIFVNPTQFNDPADLDRYPRTLNADLAICDAAGADFVFVPDVATVYPDNANPATPASTAPTLSLPLVATQPQLEDAHRPGHFAGVCQVVSRLFNLTAPSQAIFGEKDWQQLQVITAMTASTTASLAAAPSRLIRIVPSPTVREPDGLAMSSRNRFLPPADRATAARVFAALIEARNHSNVNNAEQSMRRLLDGAGLSIEYAVIRDAATLRPRPDSSHSTRSPHAARALIAARLGNVRLLDNAPWDRAS
jgi:pantoate--beta-alanine ligase